MLYIDVEPPHFSHGPAPSLPNERNNRPRLLLVGRELSTASPPQQSDSLETQQDLYARLTAPQRQFFDNAMLALKEKRYADALETEKTLRAEMPGNPLLAEYASEAALNVDAPGFAITQLEPIVKSAPRDWRAAAAGPRLRTDREWHLPNRGNGAPRKSAP